MIGIVDDRSIIRNTIVEIKDLYKEVMQLRNEDRQKYKEMCTRLEALEKDRSKRLKKRGTGAKKDRTKRKDASKNAKVVVDPNAPKKTPSKNDNAADAGTKTDEKGPEKEEKE